VARAPFRGRLTYRQRIERNNAIDRFYASTADNEPQFQVTLAPKRERIRRPVDNKPVAPLEKDIQRAILQAIGLRRDVVFVGRFNRGQAVAGNADGSTRYTPFNSVPGFPDIHGLLVGGKAFYIEVKRPPPNYEKPSTTQQDFLDAARTGGAYAGVAVSVEEALALLPT
jgi:hypothetical protein